MTEERYGKSVDISACGDRLIVMRSGKLLRMTTGDEIVSVHVAPGRPGMLDIVLIGAEQICWDENDFDISQFMF